MFESPVETVGIGSSRLVGITIGLMLIFVMELFAAQAVSAQCTGGECEKGKQEAADNTRTATAEIVNNYNALSVAFDGWSAMFDGYRRSPILFDPLSSQTGGEGEKGGAKGKGGGDSGNPELSRKYPELMYPPDNGKAGGGCSYCGQIGRSVAAINIAVDDEIYKTTMAMYQPLRWMERDFAESKIARDDHLGLFETVQGVATLTLSYLDKTVAAGLASLQQRADMNTNNHLLKQIAWSTRRISEPQREHAYIDTDEKVEACLQELAATSFVMDEEGAKGGDEYTGERSDERVRFSAKAGGKNAKSGGKQEIIDACKPYCGEYEDSQGEKGGEKNGGGGAYAFCICCAERSTAFNLGMIKAKSGKKAEGEEQEEKGDYFSLVDRLFYGKNEPSYQLGGDPNASEAKLKYMKKVVDYFRLFYGDIEVGRVDQENWIQLGQDYITPWPSSQTSQRAPKNPTIGYRFRPPGSSVAQRVNLFRHAECAQEDEFLACPITGIKIKYGICPALKTIIECLHQPEGHTASTGINCPDFFAAAQGEQ
ncbi:MAG: hypothetical protein R3245_11740, partial [Kiloniellales bacterium]|nr:hypothetical protein [Kiloniellales bacterium]